ncbi:pentapeptide repeat-containing protein [Actinokineospora pegani]|uniref:pentapeptide repeat-containing protein n=1 Tax=Actinokineospora pegani TaxID=2654637 RepID=UPI0018D2CE6F|nr:pentapeptide repeat-containing protein [Actinokineospora pegani]
MSKKLIGRVAVAIAAATLALTVWLWWAGTAGLSGDKLVTARLDALRTGLSFGLGGGGLFALYLAWRRQHSTEVGLRQKERDQEDVARAYELQREDSLAKRITELYTKAVEQLGSDKAPVRLGGLYALERLAQDHAEQRQTIVNVLCAYLRMPFTLPSAAEGTEHRESVQEREVRITAQRILSHHLVPGHNLDKPNATFWSDIDLDLTRAILIDFSLSRCRVREAQFSGATFTGGAEFTLTTFTGDAGFEDATFTDYAGFGHATFTGDVEFMKVAFTGFTDFGEATFTGFTRFALASFTGNAEFEGATFAARTCFDEAAFTGEARFSGVTFTGDAQFDETKFRQGVPSELAQLITP